MKIISFVVFAFVFVGFVCCAEAGATVEKSVGQRVAERTFPSVFQAWSGADNLNGEDAFVTMARHDLAWHGVGWFGLEWDKSPSGLGEGFSPASIRVARSKRRALLKLNPNMILIAEIRYRDASRRFLPTGHEWWLRDEQGSIVKGWAEGRFLRLDFHNSQFREHVARRAKAVVQSGAVDGVMLDWWRDDDDRLALVKAVREAIGDEYLIIANANDRTTPRTAPYINGYFMECTRSSRAADWSKIAATLRWAEKNLRPPRVNCLEIWYHTSRADLNLMRATTTLVLTCSDGYCLFSDPNPLPRPDHLHNWYPFWDKSLGRPVGRGFEKADGSITREFANGSVVYNPMGNGVVSAEFPSRRTSLATGESSTRHTVAGGDGDIFLKR